MAVLAIMLLTGWVLAAASGYSGRILSQANVEKRPLAQSNGHRGGGLLDSHGGRASTSTARAHSGGVLWKANMENGTLAQWNGRGGGGIFDSQGGRTSTSTARAHSGRWSAVLALPHGAGGTRLFRWEEPHRYRTLTYEAWFYFPLRYQLVQKPSSNGPYWNLFQFKSSSPGAGRNDPFWIIDVKTSPTGQMIPELAWWPRTLEGPRRGQSGYRTRTAPVAFPIRRWFRLTARLKQSSRFDGSLRVWLDGRQIFNEREVRTGYVNCGYNRWCVDQAWSVNLYSDGLVPRPSTINVDDARIMR